MKINLLYFFCLFSVFFVSCSSDDPNDNPGDIEVRKRVTRINYSDGHAEYYTFKYNKDGKLDYMTEKQNEERIFIYAFSYNSDGTLKSVIQTDDIKKEKIAETNFTYKDPLNIEVDGKYYGGIGTVIMMPTKLTLNSKAQLIRKDPVSSVPSVSYYFDYEYDSKGNFSNVTEKSNVSKIETTFKYDDKNSYFSNQGLPLWYWLYHESFDFDPYVGPNNLMELYFDGELDKSYKYDYDEDGYPTAIYNKLKNNKKIGEFVYEIVK